MGFWPRQIARQIGWQLYDNKRLSFKVIPDKPALQLLFVHDQPDQGEPIQQIVEEDCLRRIFKYYQTLKQTVSTTPKSFVSDPYRLEPGRLVFYEDYEYNKEVLAIPSVDIRSKLIPRKRLIFFELAFYKAAVKSVAMKQIADHLLQHDSEPLAFSESIWKKRWIEWSKSGGPFHEAWKLRVRSDIPEAHVRVYNYILNQNNGYVMREYDLERIWTVYWRRKSEIFGFNQQESEDIAEKDGSNRQGKLVLPEAGYASLKHGLDTRNN